MGFTEKLEQLNCASAADIADLKNTIMQIINTTEIAILKRTISELINATKTMKDEIWSIKSNYLEPSAN